MPRYPTSPDTVKSLYEAPARDYLKLANEYAREEEKRVEAEQTYIHTMMEEMANQPKEPLGKRQPGEKGSYEILKH